MARWIKDGAAEADAQSMIQSEAIPLPVAEANAAGGNSGRLAGMAALASHVQLPTDVASLLEAELLAEGAVHIKELTPEDRAGLSSFARLKPFQQRRLMSAVGASSR